jgi:lipoprotein-anchoring transpeptidase ErfK/SrfK
MTGAPLLLSFSVGFGLHYNDAEFSTRKIFTCLSAFSRHIPRLLAVSLLGLMVLYPASAQTSSESEARELGAFALGAGTINPGTLETGPHAAATAPETNEKVESDRGIEPESGPSTAQAESKAANSELTRDGSQILIDIDKSRQEMTVFVDGIEQHTWPVSTGGRGYATPSGNFTASSMNELWYSKQWDNAPMPNSIFFTKEGHAIHGSYETKKLGRAVSHGCVRLAPENAKTLYALVEEQGLENTKIVLSGLTPGGEAKVASQARSKNRNRQAGTAWYDSRDYHAPWPQKRGLFGRRSFGGPYNHGPQGYFRPPPGYYPPRRYAE